MMEENKNQRDKTLDLLVNSLAKSIYVFERRRF